MFRTVCCRWFAVVALVLGFWIGDTGAQDSEKDPPPSAKRPYRTFFVTRSMASDRLFPYLEAARPELVQIGQYGAMFHGYADQEKSTGTPMQLPFPGERKVLAFQRELNAKLHERGHKVVGHFRLIKVMGNWEERSGFVDYYDNHWPKDLLGPKPHSDLAELLARDSEGVPIPLSRYGMGQLGFCLSSPHARQLFKQMLKVAVDHGVDGVMTTYNYRYDCVCDHCQGEFKSWLGEKLSKEAIREKLGIEDLESHRFTSIPARITGYPIDPKDPEAEATELDWLAMRWGAEQFKRMYDEIFIEYGRTLKKDLLVARWDHLSQVSLTEERNFVPLDLWGKGEDYFWYSGGASFAPKKLNLKEGVAGDAWLSSLYVRELGGGKPFVMGKYDGLRMAASMAEGFATGALGMGRYMRFEDPYAFDVLVRYTNFMHDHRELYDGAKPFADAALVLPRQSVWNRRPDALAEFREIGQALVERQVLIDVLVDERITAKRLSDYPAVILPKVVSLSDGQLTALRDYREAGGRILVRGDEIGTLDHLGNPRKSEGIGKVDTIAGETAKDAADASIALLRRDGGASKIESPWTVRAAAYRQPERLMLHLVNYDRDESKPESRKKAGPMLERPTPVEEFAVNFRLPESSKATAVTLYAPERKEALQIPFDSRPGRVGFTVPQLRVYGVVAIEISDAP